MFKNKFVILIFFGLTTLNVTLLIAYYRVALTKIQAQIEVNLDNQSRFFLNAIDLEEYKNFISNPQSKDGDPQYTKMTKALNDEYKVMKDRDKFVYTLILKDKKVLFGLDVTPKGDADNDGVEEHGFYLNSYFDASEELKSYDGKQEPILTSVYSDRWGSFISYYKPMFYKDTFLGFLGIDMNVDLYMKDISQLQFYCLVAFAIMMMKIVGLCTLIYRMMKKIETTHQMELELKEKKQELELVELSKLATIGEFSSVLTHEINNPLQSIWTQVEMIDLYLEVPNSGNKIQEVTSKIIDSLQKIQDIIKSTKNLLRNDSEDQAEDTDFLTLLNQTKILFLDKIKKNNIEFRTNLTEGVLINCNPSQIQQVILNTINNSIFSIKGLDKKWIEIRHSQSLDYHIFSVIDSGPELSDEIQQKIKHKFFSTKKNGEGSGLGLSICSKIIKKHGGDFYYNPNMGTVCFEFKLPKAKCEKIKLAS